MPPSLKSLAYRHPEHVESVEYWQLLQAVVEGGSSMTDAMKRRILPNPDGRPADVMDTRIKLATYVNKIGSILSRFNSQLFAQGATYSGSKDKFWAEKFFSSGALLDGDDDGRASFNTLLMQAMFSALATGKAIAQVDTRVSSGAPSFGMQRETGDLEPYVVLHPRSALWDWGAGGEGFNFVKLQQFRLVRMDWASPPVPEHDFTIYQRDGRRIYASRYTVQKVYKENETPEPEPLSFKVLKDDEVKITTLLENEEIFNVNGVFEFPVLTLTLPKALHMGAQLFEPQKSYFAQTAALEYALYSNNFAMPVITGVENDDDDPFEGRKVGEGYYLTLKPGQSITTFERSGGTIGTAINYRNELKRDILDTLQQIAMAAADGSPIVANSGEVVKQTRKPEELLLERYGQMVKEFAVQILKAAAIAHNEVVDWQADGFDDFVGEGLLSDIAEYKGIAEQNIPSPTFKKAVAGDFVRTVGRSMKLNSQVVTKSLEEIESAKPEDFAPPGGAQPGMAPETPPEGNAPGEPEEPAEPEEDDLNSTVDDILSDLAL